MVLVLEAKPANIKGDYQEAYQLWSEMAGENTNFKYAFFVGLGNAMLQIRKYDESTEVFSGMQKSEIDTLIR